MIYLDTSVLVALFANEARSAEVSNWYAGCAEELVSTVWCVTEFASALGIKQRTGQMDQAAAQAAWHQFERLCANDLKLLPLEPTVFHRAALLALEAASGLRSGDSLHLAAALAAGAGSMATLDGVLAKNASRLGLSLVPW
ncbi:MAG: type II toxin-antitoxin system VapC family toxin [Rhodocyclaceae bacterium]|nr:type II toxin-antitoxin system VapC family toxin [Rhodocyclaceae bacterium]